MKRIANIIFISAFIFLYGCEKDSYRPFSESQVKIEKSDLAFTAAGGTGSIVVGISGQYTATVDQNWCKLNTSGNTITVTVEPNMNANARTANVTIKAGDLVNFVPVTQTPVYIRLESIAPINFLGKGGTSEPITYECEVPVTTVTSDASWVTGYAQDGKIYLVAEQNPNFLNNRKTSVTLGNNLTSVKLDIVQGEAITSVDPDPDIDAVGNFLDLNNNPAATPTSRYKVTLLSANLETYRANLAAAYPAFKEIRIEAPRGAYGASIILYNDDSGSLYYFYWNCTNGLARLNGSNYNAVFVYSGASYGGIQAPYTSNANYTSLFNFFTQATGFTIFQDANDVYYFRSITDPNSWFMVEPAQW